MRVHTKISGSRSLVERDGPHALSWAYMLDLIYSHAYHEQVGDLKFLVGHPELAEEIEIRAAVTGSSLECRKTAIAHLCTNDTDITASNPDVMYTVEYGWLSPRSQRQEITSVPSGMVLSKQYSVFTWKARYFGIPIRLATILKRPDLFDRFMKRMRRVFLTDNYVPAYYHLKIWRKSA